MFGILLIIVNKLDETIQKCSKKVLFLAHLVLLWSIFQIPGRVYKNVCTSLEELHLLFGRTGEPWGNVRKIGRGKRESIYSLFSPFFLFQSLVLQFPLYWCKTFLESLELSYCFITTITSISTICSSFSKLTDCLYFISPAIYLTLNKVI